MCKKLALPPEASALLCVDEFVRFPTSETYRDLDRLAQVRNFTEPCRALMSCFSSYRNHVFFAVYCHDPFLCDAYFL